MVNSFEHKILNAHKHKDIKNFGFIEALSWFNWWVSFAPEFQCYYFCESSCLFYLSLNSDFYVSKILHL